MPTRQRSLGRQELPRVEDGWVGGGDTEQEQKGSGESLETLKFQQGRASSSLKASGMDLPQKKKTVGNLLETELICGLRTLPAQTCY